VEESTGDHSAIYAEVFIRGGLESARRMSQFAMIKPGARRKEQALNRRLNKRSYLAEISPREYPSGRREPGISPRDLPSGTMFSHQPRIDDGGNIVLTHPPDSSLYFAVYCVLYRRLAWRHAEKLRALQCVPQRACLHHKFRLVL
jgi:hypothetical protein